MNWSFPCLVLSWVFATPPLALAADEPVPADVGLPAIVELEGISPEPAVFKDSKRDAPLVLRSKDEAAKYFGEEALAALVKQVDFEKQFVLVFAWAGSGQDRLSYEIAESSPEQIGFKLTPGRTRDLRQHVHIYALRSDVTWSVK